jgi:hypothetical protein
MRWDGEISKRSNIVGPDTVYERWGGKKSSALRGKEMNYNGTSGCNKSPKSKG